MVVSAGRETDWVAALPFVRGNFNVCQNGIGGNQRRLLDKENYSF